MARLKPVEKQRTTVYFDPETHAKLAALATQWRMPLTRVIEDLTERGLAQASGEQVEREALPQVRAVVEDVLRAELIALRVERYCVACSVSVHSGQAWARRSIRPVET